MSHFSQHPMSDEELAKYRASLQNAAYAGDRMTWLNSAMQNAYVPPAERPAKPVRAHDWDRFARWNLPPLMATSNAPKPYKPPVFWNLFWLAVAAVWGVAFAFGLAWVILSPLMPPTGMP